MSENEAPPRAYLVGTPGGNRLVEGVAELRLTADNDLLLFDSADACIAVFAPGGWTHAVVAPAAIVEDQ